MSRGERFASGVMAGLIGPLGIAVVNFFLLPRLVHGFGEENYGAFLVMLSCAGWVTLMHMGAGLGIIRFIAEAISDSDRAAARTAALNGAKLQLGASLLASLVVWSAAPWLIGRGFDFPPSLVTHGVWMIRAAAVAGFFMAVSAWSTSVFQGYQSYRRFGLITLAQGTLPNIGAVAVLAAGRGLGGATAWFVIIQGLIAAASCLEFWRMTRDDGAAGAGGGVDLRTFSAYCIGFWPGTFASFASGQLVRVFIAGLRSLAEFTLYAVPLGLLQRMQMLPAAASSALLPVIGGIDLESGAELERVYLRCSRVLVALLAPAYALLFSVMPQFLSLWMGGRFGDESVWPARVMVLTQAIGLLGFLPAAIAAGRKGGVWTSASQWSQAVICLALWPMLIPRWGLLGAALGSLVAQVAATGIVMWYSHYRAIRLDPVRFIKEALWPALAGTILLMTVVWTLRNRVDGWATLIALCAAGAVAYAATAWVLLPVEDQRFLRQRLKALRPK